MLVLIAYLIMEVTHMIDEVNKAVNAFLRGLNEAERLTVFETGDMGDALAVYHGLDPQSVPRGWDIVLRRQGDANHFRIILWPQEFSFYDTDEQMKKLVLEVMPALCAFADGYIKALRDKKEEEERTFECKTRIMTKVALEEGFELRRVWSR
jgi:hypothetical protein